MEQNPRGFAPFSLQVLEQVVRPSAKNLRQTLFHPRCTPIRYSHLTEFAWQSSAAASSIAPLLSSPYAQTLSSSAVFHPKRKEAEAYVAELGNRGVKARLAQLETAFQLRVRRKGVPEHNVCAAHVVTMHVASRRMAQSAQPRRSARPQRYCGARRRNPSGLESAVELRLGEKRAGQFQNLVGPA